MALNKITAFATLAILGILVWAFIVKPYLGWRSANQEQQAAMSYQAEYEQALQACMNQADSILIGTCTGIIQGRYKNGYPIHQNGDASLIGIGN